MKDTIKTSRTAGYLEKIFRAVNADWFGGELEEPIRLGCNGGGGGTDPTDGSGEHTGDGSNKLSHVCNFLSLDFSGSGESGTGRQQTLEQTNTQTTQGNTYASQQQDRLIRDGGSYGSDPADSGGEHGTNRGQQRADSDGSNLSRLATLLSSVISK